MKKMGWGFGLATAGMVFMASHALALTGGSGTESTGSTGSTTGTMGESSGSSTGSAATSGPSATRSGTELQGKVEKFNRSKNTLTLSGSSKTLKVDSSTKVMKDGSNASLDDIKEGDEIRASYSGSGNTVKVKSLDIMSAGSMGTDTGMGTSPSPSSPSTGTGTGTETTTPP